MRADTRRKGPLLPAHASRLAALSSLHLADSCAANCWPAGRTHAAALAQRVAPQGSDWQRATGGKRSSLPAADLRPATDPGALAGGVTPLTGMPTALAGCMSDVSEQIAKRGRAISMAALPTVAMHSSQLAALLVNSAAPCPCINLVRHAQPSTKPIQVFA